MHWTKISLYARNHTHIIFQDHGFYLQIRWSLFIATNVQCFLLSCACILTAQCTIITKQIKVTNTLLILNKDDYNRKVKEFMSQNSFMKLLQNVTNKQQIYVRNNINTCNNAIKTQNGNTWIWTPLHHTYIGHIQTHRHTYSKVIS
jgi:hypothetical protein